METSHEYGEAVFYYCPKCDFTELRHWPPPYAFCPDCGDAMLRQSEFEWVQEPEGRQ